jgi:hypothetical protein
VQAWKSKLELVAMRYFTAVDLYQEIRAAQENETVNRFWEELYANETPVSAAQN